VIGGANAEEGGDVSEKVSEDPGPNPGFWSLPGQQIIGFPPHPDRDVHLEASLHDLPMGGKTPTFHPYGSWASLFDPATDIFL